MGVLVIKYFPLTADGKFIDLKVTGDIGESFSVIRQRTIDATKTLKSSLENATRYLGYKDSSAQSALRYQIIDTKEYTQAVPLDPITRRPLYRQIMLDHNICDYMLITKESGRYGCGLTKGPAFFLTLMIPTINFLSCQFLNQL